MSLVRTSVCPSDSSIQMRHSISRSSTSAPLRGGALDYLECRLMNLLDMANDLVAD